MTAGGGKIIMSKLSERVKGCWFLLKNSEASDFAPFACRIEKEE